MNNDNYSKWKNSEVIKLFNFITDCRQKNIPLIRAFDEYSTFTGRKPNSVRNYYYQELKELEKNSSRKDLLGIDISAHKKQEFKEFTEKEEYDLAFFILQKRRQGRSVRSSCIELSRGDVSVMIRYQNKFRSLIKQNPTLIESINKKLDEIEGVKTVTGKVLNFPKANPAKINGKLSDEELKGLFMGLVKLVKKSATLEISSTLKAECNYLGKNLRHTLVAMSKKQKAIIELTERNKSLKSKLGLLEEKVKQLRTKSINSTESKNKS
jgi:hypothetical protein